MIADAWFVCENSLVSRPGVAVREFLSTSRITQVSLSMIRVRWNLVWSYRCFGMYYVCWDYGSVACFFLNKKTTVSWNRSLKYEQIMNRYFSGRLVAGFRIQLNSCTFFKADLQQYQSQCASKERLSYPRSCGQGEWRGSLRDQLEIMRLAPSPAVIFMKVGKLHNNHVTCFKEHWADGMSHYILQMCGPPRYVAVSLLIYLKVRVQC